MLKQIIIEECKKYDYEYLFDQESDGCLIFRNPNVESELETFIVNIDQYLEEVSMYLSIDMSSFGEAQESNINDLEDIKENIYNWLNKNNLDLIREWLY
jgi:hypothetical protein